MSATTMFAQDKVIGYTSSWAGNEDEIQFANITHLNYAFIFPNIDGTLSEIDDTEKLRRIVSKAHKHNVKVYISVAGDNLGSENKEDLLWETISQNPKSKKTLVKEILNFVDNYNLDGVDVFWTYPTSTHSGKNLLSFITDLNLQLITKGKELSTVVAPMGEMANYFPSEIFEKVNHVNILSYESTDLNSFNFDFAQKSLNYWITKGLSREKAIVGIPFHSKNSWESYENMIVKGANPFDNFHQGETYNGVHQVLAKTELAKNEAGGIMIWEITHDADGPHSLLSAIHHVKSGKVARHHIHTLNNVRVNTLSHKEILLENIDTVEELIGANIQFAKKIKLID